MTLRLTDRRHLPPLQTSRCANGENVGVNLEMSSYQTVVYDTIFFVLNMFHMFVWIMKYVKMFVSFFKNQYKLPV